MWEETIFFSNEKGRMTLRHILVENWVPRFIFVALTFCVLFGSSSIVRIFKKTLEENIELSFFMSLVIGHAGNCGGQTVATVVRHAQTCDVTREIMIKETFLTVLSTFTITILFIFFSQFIRVNTKVIIVASSTLLIISPLASIIGTTCCRVAKYLERDPAIYAGPIVTTFVDLFGILCYIGLANLFL